MHHPNVPDLEALASRTAAENGYDLCSLNLLTNLNPIKMQVHICRNGGEDVSIDDCALLSEPMEQAIENSKLLIEDYVLEISSPGIQDLLTTERDFITFKGFPVEVTFRNQKQPEAHLTGLLKGRTSEDIQLNIKGRSCRIPIEDLISVRLVSPSG